MTDAASSTATRAREAYIEALGGLEATARANSVLIALHAYASLFPEALGRDVVEFFQERQRAAHAAHHRAFRASPPT